MADHDSLYHRFFSYPGMVVDLLKNFLDPKLLKELDLSNLRRVNTKFTAPQGQRRRGDVVWEIPIRDGGNLYLLLILEFQSETDEWMALRINVYTGLLYQQLVNEKKLKAKDGLPPVLPIVLFNGEPNWNAPTSLGELIRLPVGSSLWKYQPEMRYYVIDEGLYPSDKLKSLESITAFLFRLEHPPSPVEVVETLGELITWFREHPDGPPVKKLFHELLVGSLNRMKGLEDLPPIPDELLEVVNMLATRIEKWEQDIAHRNLQAGEQKGGTSLLLLQLEEKFGGTSASIRNKVLSADRATLEKWSLRFVRANTLDDVFGV